MNNMRFQVPRSVTFRLLEGASDVAIKGEDKDTVELMVDGDPEQCQVEQHEGTLVVRCTTAFSASIPGTADVQIEQVAGDLVLRNLFGSVSVNSVAGDTLAQSLLGPLSIQTAHGDLTTEEVNGPLTVQTAHGDVRLRQHTAPVTIGTVHGDLRVKSMHSTLQAGMVNGDVRVHEATSPVKIEQASGDFVGEGLIGGLDVRVNGEVTLRTFLTPGVSYRAHADSNINARFPGSVSARFVLRAQGALSAKLPQIEKQEQGLLIGQAGAGEAQVELEAGGDLVLKLREEDHGFEVNFAFNEDIASQVEAQIAQTLEGLDIDGLAQREMEKAMRRAEREIARAQEHAERTRQRVEEQARHAQERAERAARKAQEKLARHFSRGFSHFGQEPQPGQRPRKPQVSEQEQLAVLKMVQEGKISIEEAERLLRALEG